MQALRCEHSGCVPGELSSCRNLQGNLIYSVTSSARAISEGRNREAKLPCRFDVDCQQKFGCPFDGKVAWLGTTSYSIDVRHSARQAPGKPLTIGEQKKAMVRPRSSQAPLSEERRGCPAVDMEERLGSRHVLAAVSAAAQKRQAAMLSHQSV